MKIILKELKLLLILIVGCVVVVPTLILAQWTMDSGQGSTTTPTDNSNISGGTETKINGASTSETYGAGKKKESKSSYFGGKVLSTVTCTCDPDTQFLTIKGGILGSGTYVYSIASTKMYAKKIVKPNSYLLGKYKTGGECLMVEGPDCVPYEQPITKGIIEYIGTSL